MDLIRSIVNTPIDFTDDFLRSSLNVAYGLGLDPDDFPKDVFNRFHTNFVSFCKEREIYGTKDVISKNDVVSAICQIVHSYFVLTVKMQSPNVTQVISTFNINSVIPRNAGVGAYCQEGVSKLHLDNNTSLANMLIALAKYYDKIELAGYEGSETLEKHAFIMVVFYLLNTFNIDVFMRESPSVHGFCQLISNIKTRLCGAILQDTSRNIYKDGYHQLLDVLMLADKRMGNEVRRIINTVRQVTSGTFAYNAVDSYPLMSWGNTKEINCDVKCLIAKNIFKLKENDVISVSSIGDLRSCLAVLSFHNKKIQYLDRPPTFGNPSCDETVIYPSKVDNNCITIIGARPSHAYCDFTLSTRSDTEEVIHLLAKEFVKEPINAALGATFDELVEQFREPYEEILSFSMSIICRYKGKIIGVSAAYPTFSYDNPSHKNEKVFVKPTEKYKPRERLFKELTKNQEETELKVARIAVDSLYQGNGIATELYKRLITNLKNRGERFRNIGCIFTSRASRNAFPNLPVIRHNYLYYNRFNYTKNPFHNLQGYAEYVAFLIRDYSTC